MTKKDIMAELVAKYPVLEGLNFEQGLTGELIFVWHGNADGSTDTGYNEKLMVGNHLSRSPNVNVKMYGDIPENAGGTIEYACSPTCSPRATRPTTPTAAWARPTTPPWAWAIPVRCAR